MSAPICLDCAHCTFDEGPTCARPLSAERSPVTGNLSHRLHSFCSNERGSERTLFGRVRCGKAARFFQAMKVPTA